MNWVRRDESNVHDLPTFSESGNTQKMLWHTHTHTHTRRGKQGSRNAATSKSTAGVLTLPPTPPDASSEAPPVVCRAGALQSAHVHAAGAWPAAR